MGIGRQDKELWIVISGTRTTSQQNYCKVGLTRVINKPSGKLLENIDRHWPTDSFDRLSDQ